MSTTESTSRTRPLGSAKITDAHRAKLAVVYVRQSTPQQVVETPSVPAGRSAIRSS
jgi:hypothetical protein